MAVINDGLSHLAGQRLFPCREAFSRHFRLRFVLALLAGLAFDGRAVTAGTIVVDWQNSGCQDGTEAHPYRTVTRAVNAAAPGDIISIRTGSYNFQSAPLVLVRPAVVRAENGPVQIAFGGSGSDGGGDDCPPPPKPKIVSFTAAPNDGYLCWHIYHA